MIGINGAGFALSRFSNQFKNNPNLIWNKRKWKRETDFESRRLFARVRLGDFEYCLREQ